MQYRLIISSALAGMLLLGIYGCSTSDVATPTTPASSAQDSGTQEDHSDHDHGDHDHAEHDDAAQNSDMAKMTAALADLSPEDQASAMKQHFCPVSGEMLGTMGAPERVDVDGTSVWICCDGCKDKLLAEPQKYLAKLAK